jgi:tetratricopeptide (TPR) repeat protein
MKFQQGRFEDAARLLEKSFRLDPEDDRIEFCNAYLGRSYLALGRTDDALDQMSRAYARFEKERPEIENEYAQREFQKFIRHYIKVLNKVGQTERANEVKAGSQGLMADMFKKAK